MKNIFKKQEWNKQPQVSDSDGYCPSIQNALFKKHKLEELLAQNKLKGLGLQTAQALIKVLYEEMKRLEIENFEYRSELQEISREAKEQQKQLKREINYLRHKLLSKRRQGENCQNRQKERRFSQSMQFITNMLMPDISKQLSITKTGNSLSKYNHQKNPSSPITKMDLKYAISKEIFETNYQKENELWNQAKRTLMSDQLDNILVDFEDISQFVHEEKHQLKVHQERCIENGIQIVQSTKEMESNCYGTTSTKPNYSEKSQYYNSFITNNKKHTIKGKKLFSTQNITQTTTSPERLKFEPYFQGKCAPKKSHHSKKQKDHQSEIIKEYQQVIQHYKEYSAYLKAYLCSCIGFIGKHTEQLQQENKLYEQETQRLSEKSQSPDDPLSTDRISDLVTPTSFNNTFPIILKDVLTTVSQKFSLEHEIRKQLEKENKQLKSILDELIKNLKHTGFPGMTDIRGKACDSGRRQTNQIKWKEKHRSKDQRNSKNKDPRININKPIIHKMTITQANNYFHPIK